MASTPNVDRLDEELTARFESERLERESRGDFGGVSAMNDAIRYVRTAETTYDFHYAEIFFTRAGMLAVKEALFEGVKIQGWDGDLPRFTEHPINAEDCIDDPVWYLKTHLSKVDSVPDRYQILAGLADNPWVREARQTGSPLIPPDREVKFARARVEKARQELAEEEAELARLEGESTDE